MKKLKETVLLACSAPPGGGRNHLTARFSRHFNILNLPQPSYEVLQKIFETMLGEFCVGLSFPDQIKQVPSKYNLLKRSFFNNIIL
jgi:dynein heavy chain, axonemal